MALLGPRQAGKTTLAMVLAEESNSLYLDLESESDLAKLAEPDLYLSGHDDKLVILDEIQRKPDLFKILCGRIDRIKREGLPGRYLLPGSASLDLLRQSSESLAGRISFLELGPLGVGEVASRDADRLWVRGGFPESFLARSDAASMRWRRDFIRTYLERNIPQLGPRIPAETLRRFWTMLAHLHGRLHNAAAIAQSLGVNGKTVAAYLDLFVNLLLVRRLEPWHENAGKRLVKSPKIYLRDSGLLHALLGLADEEDLSAHPVCGASWEGFVIENLLSVLPEGTQACFYRIAAGAEIDLVLQMPGQRWAVEIKRSLSPTPKKGFHMGCEDLGVAARRVVYPGVENYPLASGARAISLTELLRKLEMET